MGSFTLDDGVLPDGTRILPEGWTEYVSAPSGPQPDGEWGYGAGWWIMSGIDGIPDDAFAAQGNRGQYVVVVPSRDVVIVRRGEDPAGGSGFDIAGIHTRCAGGIAEYWLDQGRGLHPDGRLVTSITRSNHRGVFMRFPHSRRLAACRHSHSR